MKLLKVKVWVRWQQELKKQKLLEERFDNAKNMDEQKFLVTALLGLSKRIMDIKKYEGDS